MKISSVSVKRIPAPAWQVPRWWSTSAMDSLFDQRAHFRGEQVGLFNATTEALAGQPVLLVVTVRTDDGLEGLGAITLGNEATACVIEHALTPLVLGENPFNVELIWEKMYRATQNIGRRGLVLIAISGIDIALWDLMGKVTSQPCYNLLGGRTRSSVRAYCSAAYAMDDLEQLAEIVQRQMARGYSQFILAREVRPLPAGHTSRGLDRGGKTTHARVTPTQCPFSAGIFARTDGTDVAVLGA